MNVVKSVKKLKLVKVVKMVKFFGDGCKGGEGVERGGGDEVVTAVNVVKVEKW